MWMRFCPMINSKCEDGKPNNSELSCCHWDSLNAECLLVSQGLLSVAFHRRSMARMDQIEELKQELVENHESTATELKAGLPKAEEFGRNMITKKEEDGTHAS